MGSENTSTDKIIMTQREVVTDNVVLKTPVGQPNVEIISMSWWKQALIRAARAYLQTLLGFVLAATTGAASAVGVNLPAGDFYKLLLVAMSISVAPAVVSLIQNAIEILSKLDVTNPQMRA